MKSSKKILLSCAAASILINSSWAGTITISDTNTTTINVLANDDLIVTSIGQINLLGQTNDKTAVVMEGTNNNILLDGSISVTGNKNFIGIELGGLMESSTIINNGTIAISTTDTFKYSKGIKAEIIDGNSKIENNGDIDITGDFYSAGIDLTQLDGNITNSGNINIARGKGIKLIDNNGIITNTSTGLINAEYGISLSGINSGTIINEGTITTTRDGIYTATNNGNITNLGTIDTVDTSGGYYAIKTGAGTGIVTNSNTINGNLNILSTGLVTNSGTINLNGEVTSYIAGDFIQTTNGTLGIDAEITGANSANYSKLIIAGTANLVDGSSIRVDVSGTDTNQTLFLMAGSQLTDVVTAGTLDVNVSKLNILDNSALLSFAAIKDGNTLDLATYQDLSIEDAVNEAGTILQSGEAANTLDGISLGEDVDIDIFKVYLNTLPTNDDVSQSIASVTPTVTIVTSTVGEQLINTIGSVVEVRQASVRGFGSGDIAFSDKNVWFKPFGGYTKQDNKDGITGFKANNFGLGFGADGEYKAGSRAGLALFYTNVNVDTNDIDQSSNLDVFNIMAYGSNPIVDDKTNLFYQIGYGYQKTDTQRTIVGINQTANANYNAQSIYLQLKATRDIEINNSFIIKPAIFTSYTYYNSPSYTESGAGGLNLNVESFTSDSFVMGIQSDFDYDINKNTKFLSNLSLSYDFNSEAQIVNSSFIGGGAVFSTQGISNDSLIYKASLGISQRFNKFTYLDFKYGFDGRGSDFVNHVISAKFNYKF